MKVIAIAMNKGGVGKSTLTRCIAVAAAENGLNVLVLDMDTQQTTTQWGRRRTAREKQLPLVRFTTENDLADELAKARAAGCDIVVIDTPPARSSEAPAAVESADLVIIPCTADIEAFEQIARTARLARTTGKSALAVLNLATPNSLSEIEAAREVFEAIGLPMAPIVLHRLKVHRDASRNGLTPQESEPSGRAAAEIVKLWEHLRTQLQPSKGATVQKCKRAFVHKKVA